MAKYAIMSDIHSNADALKSVLDKCRELGVEQYLSLGDIVGYNAEPALCLQQVRSLPILSMVRGNHDEYASGDDTEIAGFNQNAKTAVLWTKNHLTEGDKKWLMSAPYRATVPSLNVTLVHATLDTPEHWGYIFDTHHASDNFSYQFTQICFCGHSHVPVAFLKKPVAIGNERAIEEINDWSDISRGGPDTWLDEGCVTVEIKPGYKYLFNIGSIGQPRNRDPRASFSVYDSDRREVSRYCVPYDIASAQEKIRAAGLPERLAVRLTTGS